MTIDWTKVLIVATALVVVIGFTAIVYADEEREYLGWETPNASLTHWWYETGH